MMHVADDACVLDERDRRLLDSIAGGLPIAPRPYSVIGKRLGWSEAEVTDRLRGLLQAGVISRFGVIVRHHELGYRANGMVVWDVPDSRVAEIGHCFGDFNFVTLCYRRPRHLPDWPYNLFTMIHGRNRDQVLDRVHELASICGVAAIDHTVLFSVRRFKQRGARYAAPVQGRGSVSLQLDGKRRGRTG